MDDLDLLDSWNEAHSRGLTQKEHAKELGMTYGEYKNKLYRAKKNGNFPRSFLEHRADGSVAVSRLLSLTMEDMLSPERVMELVGFDPEKWKVRSCKFNDWNAQRPDDLGQLVNHQVTLIVEPKKIEDVGAKEITRFFESYTPLIKAKKIKHKQYSLSGNALEIALGDLHNARMSPKKPAKSTRENLEYTISDIVSRAKGKRFSVVYFAPLGDVSDADNMNATTTKGTQQFITMTPYSMLSSTAEMMIESVDRLREIAPVKYIFVPGNHDEMLSYAVAKIVEAYFKDANDVTVNASEDKHKWDTFGLCLLAWTHGDIAKSNMFDWLPVRAREAWGRCKFAEVHSGHINDQKVYEKAGQVIRFLPSISDLSLWEDGKGYGGLVRSTASFVWNSSKGLQEQWFTNL